MEPEFVRLRLKGDKNPMSWDRAVRISAIISIMPIHSEANKSV